MVGAERVVTEDGRPRTEDGRQTTGDGRPKTMEEEFFRCKHFRCILMKIRCVQRQNRAIEEAIRDARGLYSLGPTSELIRFEACIRCEQGREIYRELTGMPSPGVIVKRRPHARRTAYRNTDT